MFSVVTFEVTQKLKQNPTDIRFFNFKENHIFKNKSLKNHIFENNEMQKPYFWKKMEKSHIFENFSSNQYEELISSINYLTRNGKIGQ